MTDNTTQDVRSLRVIATEIIQDWPKARDENHPAGAYAVPMLALDKVTDSYFFDSGSGIVRGFLANAGTWRGETARRVKAELKSMTEGVY